MTSFRKSECRRYAVCLLRVDVVQRWSPVVDGLFVVVFFMLVQTSGFAVGSLRATNGQVEGV